MLGLPPNVVVLKPTTPGPTSAVVTTLYRMWEGKNLPSAATMTPITQEHT